MFDKSKLPTDCPMYEDIDQINRSVASMRSLLKGKVCFEADGDIPMLRSQVEIFFQAHLRRALMFLDGGKLALDTGYGLVTLTAVRCLYESAACVHDFCNQVIKHMDAGELTEAVRLAHQRAFAQRFEVKEMNTGTFDYTAVNILKQIDSMGRTVPGARRSYDQLSEIVHPNAFGALLYFMQSTDDGYVLFGTDADERTKLASMLLAGASLFSLIESDIWRFHTKVLDLVQKDLQAKIDDYDARKKAKG
jgi:hypothetical protein